MPKVDEFQYLKQVQHASMLGWAKDLGVAAELATVEAALAQHLVDLVAAVGTSDPNIGGAVKGVYDG